LQFERLHTRGREAVLPQRKATLCILVGSQGFEPRAPKSTDLQSAAVANAARYPLCCMIWISDGRETAGIWESHANESEADPSS
jgi:hypothetical protein